MLVKKSGNFSKRWKTNVTDFFFNNAGFWRYNIVCLVNIKKSLHSWNKIGNIIGLRGKNTQHYTLETWFYHSGFSAFSSLILGLKIKRTNLKKYSSKVDTTNCRHSNTLYWKIYLRALSILEVRGSARATTVRVVTYQFVQWRNWPLLSEIKKLIYQNTSHLYI